MTQADELRQAQKVLADAINLAFDEAERLRIALQGVMREVTTLQTIQAAVSAAAADALDIDLHDWHPPVADDAARAIYEQAQENEHA